MEYNISQETKWIARKKDGLSGENCFTCHNANKSPQGCNHISFEIRKPAGMIKLIVALFDKAQFQKDYPTSHQLSTENQFIGNKDMSGW